MEQYEDLDEILARYAEPFAQHIKQIKSHRWPLTPWESSLLIRCCSILGPRDLLPSLYASIRNGLYITCSCHELLVVSPRCVAEVTCLWSVHNKRDPFGKSLSGQLTCEGSLQLQAIHARAQLHLVEQLCSRLQALLRQRNSHLCVHACRKYREGPWEHVKAQLMQEKQRTPGAGAAYVLGAKQETPGVFYIAFIVSKTPRKEFMLVTGEGVYFRHEASPFRHSARRDTGIAGREESHTRALRSRYDSVCSPAGIQMCSMAACAEAYSCGQWQTGMHRTHACSVSLASLRGSIDRDVLTRTPCSSADVQEHRPRAGSVQEAPLRHPKTSRR